MKVKETTLYEVGDVFEVNGKDRFVLVQGQETEDDGFVGKTLELVSLTTFINDSGAITVRDEITGDDILSITPGIWEYIGTFAELYKAK